MPRFLTGDLNETLKNYRETYLHKVQDIVCTPIKLNKSNPSQFFKLFVCEIKLIMTGLDFI